MSGDFVFDKIKNQLLKYDPVWFAEKYLTIDGEPFRLHGNGWKPFADIYRYIGIKGVEKGSLPVVVVAGRQVGKTSMAAALEMYFVGCGLFGNGKNPPIRIIHAFPFLDMAYSYSKVKLNSMIGSSIILDQENLPKGTKAKPYMKALLDTTSESNDSLQFKQFIGGNHIWIESVGTQGDRLRGKTIDVIFFDEVQKMYSAAINNSIKVLTQAKYGEPGQGVQVFFGTPLQRGSTYWEMWNASSRQYYHLGCEKCKKHFPLYTGDNSWEEVWLYGFIVRCSNCGFEQDKREAVERGKWVATSPNADAKYIGFHINQLYVPTYTKEKILAEKPENNPLSTEKGYQNEVLGEFYHGEATIITQDQVRELCGDPERKFRASISPGDDLCVFLGIDIGAKNDLTQLVDDDRIAKSTGQSFSTAVVIAMTGPQRISVEFATKFKRNDLASKKGLIDQIMKQYSVNLAVCDLGYAQDLNEILQTEYGEKFLASQASGRVNEKIKFNGEIFPKVILFERDFWIAELYEKMKTGNIRLPFGSYEQISAVVQHLCSMEIKPSISRTGDISAHYIKGSGQNDFLMALLNAYIAYKYYISNGFKIKNTRLNNGFGQKEKPMILTGYVPKMR